MIVPFLLLLLSTWGGAEASFNCTLPDNTTTTDEGRGVLCRECLYSGYLNQQTGDCVCLLWQMDPNQQCYGAGLRNRTLSHSPLQHGRAPCVCFTDDEKGYWSSSTEGVQSWANGSYQYVYSLTHPPLCDQCLNDYYGPRPETLTYSALQLNSSACVKWGGPDPQLSGLQLRRELINQLEGEVEGCWPLMIGMNALTMVPLRLLLVVVVKMVGGWKLSPPATLMNLSPPVLFVRALGALPSHPLTLFSSVPLRGPLIPLMVSRGSVRAMVNS
jgi:hypothetical protein